jgi:hypothetical protein
MIKPSCPICNGLGRVCESPWSASGKLLPQGAPRGVLVDLNSHLDEANRGMKNV